MSFVKVGVLAVSAAEAAPGSTSAAVSAHAPIDAFRPSPCLICIMLVIPSPALVYRPVTFT